MPTQTKPTQQTEQELKQWSQNQYVKISKYCASKGYSITQVVQSKCQSLPPLLAIWYAKTTDKSLDLWVISGEFPTDLVAAQAAKNAREVLRHFSMSWHVQAANLEEELAKNQASLGNKETQIKLAKDLTNKAEKLYDVFRSDPLWKNSGLTI